LRREGLDPDAGTDWTSAAERGSRWGLRLLVWSFRHFGHGPMRLLLAPIATWYWLFAPSARRPSRAYLQRLHRVGGFGHAPRWLDTWQHIYSFAGAILDRFAFWAGAYQDFEIAIRGREHMQPLIEAGRGAVLVGAHLGSFDVLRVIARDFDVRVNVLMFSANARRINDTIQVLDPGSKARVIDLDPTSVHFAFEIRRSVERGEFVAVLADRVHPGGRRVTHTTFLGDPAPFPQGPFLLATLLGLPVVLCLALKTGPRAYEIVLESLGGGEPVPAQDREKRVQEQIEAYAARLEHHCARFPLQWFNFYDFWGEGAGD
jgi:predicted LPLAT superfamily acyltransferase